MTTVAYVVGESSLRLWGLTSRERLERQLRAAGINIVQRELGDYPDTVTVLILNSGYVFEQRTVSALAQQPASLLECPQDGSIAAAIAPGSRARELAALVAHSISTRPADLQLLQPEFGAQFDGALRKSEPTLLEPLSADNRTALEQRLYGNSYKGVTDLVTKWLWPRPARALVRLCTCAGITPNVVTLTGLLLVVVAAVLFAGGHYVSGIVCGWIMTLLDTVDGKLARVTIQASRIGHWLDHGMDIVHPPFWYVLWGVGLPTTIASDELYLGHALIVGGYLAGRAIEGAFHALGTCSMFAWRPFDAYFRLVTARRNPCLIILTMALLCRSPTWGFLGVAGWTALSSAIMFVRLCYAARVRASVGPLNSWLTDPGAAIDHSRAYRTFASTRGAYG